MVAAPRRPATYEDVLAAPEGVVVEVLFGVLHTNPRPAAPRAIAASRLGTELGAREGVRHAWLLDPVDRTIEVYALDGGRRVRVRVARGDGSVHLEPFDVLPLDLRALWEL